MDFSWNVNILVLKIQNNIFIFQSHIFELLFAKCFHRKIFLTYCNFSTLRKYNYYLKYCSNKNNIIKWHVDIKRTRHVDIMVTLCYIQLNITNSGEHVLFNIHIWYLHILRLICENIQKVVIWEYFYAGFGVILETRFHCICFLNSVEHIPKSVWI